MSADSPAPVTALPSKAGDGVEIGVARLDGIRASGSDMLITRNGSTEKLSKELILPHGVRVDVDGKITLSDGSTTTLRIDQLLTFDGQILQVPPSPNENIGARNLPPPSSGAAGRSGDGTQQTVAGTPPASSRSPVPNRGSGGGSVFLGSDGTPFLGTLNPDGSITQSDGSTIFPDGTTRALSFGQDGTPMMGRINANGSVTRQDGSTQFPDGSVRASNGSLISPPTGNSPMTNQQVQNPQSSQQTRTSDQQLQATNPQAPQNQNTPGNVGTANNGNSNPGVSSNAGTGQAQTNNGVSSRRSPAGRTNGTRATNGSSGGAVNGGGASGAGGAPGGSGGGVSR